MFYLTTICREQTSSSYHTGGADVQYYLLYKERGQGQYREQFMGVREGFKYVFKHRKTGTEYEFTMKSRNR